MEKIDGNDTQNERTETVKEKEAAPGAGAVHIENSARRLGYAGLFKAFGFLVVLVAVLFTLIQWFYNDSGDTSSSVPAAPKGVHSPTLDPGEQKYRELLAEKNRREFSHVVERGGSVVPPPIGKPVESPPPPPPSPPPVQTLPTPPPPVVSKPPRHQMVLDRQLVETINQALALSPHENVVIIESDPKTLEDAMDHRASASSMPTPEMAQAGVSETEKGALLVSPGQVLYGSFDTAINTDYRVPVLRVTLAGPKLRGWRLLGGYQQNGDKMVVRFNSLVAPSGKMYPVEAYAIDPQSALPAMADGVDYHWIRRYVLRFAGLFLQGVGQAASQPNTRIDTVSSGAVSTMTGGLGMADQIKMGLGRVGAAIGRDMERFSQRPPTVWIDPGTPLGVIFVTPVYENGQKRAKLKPWN